jgi:hypothetical protein
MVQIRLAYLQNKVALYKTLGGEATGLTVLNGLRSCRDLICGK